MVLRSAPAAILIGALLSAAPTLTLAAEHGGRSASGHAPSFGGGHVGAFRAPAAPRSYAAPRAYAAPRTYAAPPRSYPAPARVYPGSGYRGGYWRGGVYIGVGSPWYGGYYGPSYVYSPTYTVAPTVTAPACPDGSYDQYGNWIPAPACYGNSPQYPSQYSQQPQYSQPQYQQPAPQSYGQGQSYDQYGQPYSQQPPQYQQPPVQYYGNGQPQR